MQNPYQVNRSILSRQNLHERVLIQWVSLHHIDGGQKNQIMSVDDSTRHNGHPATLGGKSRDQVATDKTGTSKNYDILVSHMSLR